VKCSWCGCRFKGDGKIIEGYGDVCPECAQTLKAITDKIGAILRDKKGARQE
jgi:hypothetical protein